MFLRKLPNPLEFQHSLTDCVSPSRLLELAPQPFDRARVHVAGNRRLPSLRGAKAIDGIDGFLRVDVGLRRFYVELRILGTEEAKCVQHHLQLEDITTDELLHRPESKRLAGGVVNAAELCDRIRVFADVDVHSLPVGTP